MYNDPTGHTYRDSLMAQGYTQKTVDLKMFIDGHSTPQEGSSSTIWRIPSPSEFKDGLTAIWVSDKREEAFKLFDEKASETDQNIALVSGIAGWTFSATAGAYLLIGGGYFALPALNTATATTATTTMTVGGPLATHILTKDPTLPVDTASLIVDISQGNSQGAAYDLYCIASPYVSSVGNKPSTNKNHSKPQVQPEVSVNSSKVKIPSILSQEVSQADLQQLKSLQSKSTVNLQSKSTVNLVMHEDPNAGVGNGVNPKTFTSPDKYVGDIANKIEAKYPGSVKDVGIKEPSVLNGLERELDVVLNDGTIIQVKKDNARNINGQLTKTKNHFPGRRVIGVHPDQHSKTVKQEINKSGNISTDSIDDLVDNILKDLGEVKK